MKKKKIFAFATSILTTIATTACTSNPYPDRKENLCYDKMVESINFKGFVTGKNAPFDSTKVEIGGTDLGYHLVDPVSGETLLFYGDTFIQPAMTGRWRSNVVGYTKETFATLDDGLTIDRFLMNRDNEYAAAAIEGFHSKGYEESKIPTGAIYLNGAYYVFYFSIYSWDSATHYMNYCGVIKSTDRGETWERVYDLSWVDHLEDIENTNNFNVLSNLVNQDVNLNPNGGNVDIANHKAYRFTQIMPRVGDDGYVYIFGTVGRYESLLSLGRVKQEKFEIFEEYEYLIGYDKSSNPQWMKGSKGLAYLDANMDKGYALSAELRGTLTNETSIFYSKKFNKYGILAMSRMNEARKLGATLFLSDNVYGPYDTEGILIIPQYNEFFPETDTYGPITSDLWQSEDGNTMFMTISLWTPYYNPYLIKVKFK